MVNRFGEATDIPDHVTLPGVRERFEAAMDDDFNTTVAIAELGEVFKWLNDFLTAKKPKMKQKAGAVRPKDALAEIQSFLVRQKNLDIAEIEALIAERIQARASKDWARADEIRDGLEARGITVMDSPEGTEWQVLP